MKDNPCATVESSDGTYAQLIKARVHEWAAGEPLEDGGIDNGPMPYELLLSALDAEERARADDIAWRKRRQSEHDTRLAAIEARLSLLEATS